MFGVGNRISSVEDDLEGILFAVIPTEVAHSQSNAMLTCRSAASNGISTNALSAIRSASIDSRADFFSTIG